jgi:AcrR family transcriptional regulator
MARPKTLPDPEVLAAVRRLHAGGGDRAVSFGTVARACRLAASTLAQRFGSVEGMLRAAARDGWADLAARTSAQAALAGDKGPQGLLKALDLEGREVALLLRLGRGDAEAASAAAAWRAQVEGDLARRLSGNDKSGGDKARAAAQALFAAWQGQLLWGDAELRLKDLARKLG